MISDVKKTEHIAEAKVKIDMIKELYDSGCLSENIVPRRKHNCNRKAQFYSKQIFCFKYPRLLSWVLVHEIPFAGNSLLIKEATFQEKILVKVAGLNRESSRCVSLSTTYDENYATVAPQFIHLATLISKNSSHETV